jgi:serine/threonine protein kinase
MRPRDPFGFSGALVDGQLQVGDPVGEGGFSVVYRAHHLGLDEPVALKCMKTPREGKMVDGIIERFRAESRISYRLSQGNLDIVRSISSGTAHSPMTGELVPYIALEWLDGASLAQELKARRAKGMTGRPLGEVIDVLDPAAVALDYAHKQGVVHRDVKPGNLVLAKSREGTTRIKVLDFGLAKVIDPEGIGLVATTQTVASVILCSPSYGAPEQFDNGLGPIGSYTDVYSFALIVLEMLRDERIRNTTSVAVAARLALARKPVSPLALNLPVTPAIDTLFQRTLQLDKNLRPRDLGEFWNELKHLATAPVSAGHVGAPFLLEANRQRVPAPTIRDMPERNVTQPMQIPPRRDTPGPRPGVGAPAAQPPTPDPERPPFMGTMLMPSRPAPPQPEPQHPPPPQPEPLGPITAPMPAISRPALMTGQALPEELPPTRPDDLSLPPRVAPPTPGVPMGPFVVPTPVRSASANPPSRSSFKVGLLVALSLLLFSSVIVTAGYLAHRWFESRAGNAGSR